MRFVFPNNNQGDLMTIAMPLDGSVKPHHRVYTDIPVEAYMTREDLTILGTESTDLDEFFPNGATEVEASVGDENYRPADYDELSYQTYNIARDAWEKTQNHPTFQCDVETSNDPDGAINEMVSKGYTITSINTNANGQYVVAGIRRV